MKVYPFLLLILTTFILTSCGNSSFKEESKTTENKQMFVHEIDVVDSSFNEFIEKFSSDSLFQLSRTKFPLQVRWFDLEKNKETMFCKEVSNFEMMDFRIKKSNTKTDNWEQKIVIEENKQKAQIE
ncbi:MAG: hypothetical protein ACOVO9_02620, partial [Bacteroidia bacterium]